MGMREQADAVRKELEGKGVSLPRTPNTLLAHLEDITDADLRVSVGTLLGMGVFTYRDSQEMIEEVKKRQEDRAEAAVEVYRWQELAQARNPRPGW